MHHTEMIGSSSLVVSRSKAFSNCVLLKRSISFVKFIGKTTQPFYFILWFSGVEFQGSDSGESSDSEDSELEDHVEKIEDSEDDETLRIF
ncbi:unnamed protein product [Allacma fusca]|uniref:Uncharacterized protein n=1 Tax=Allacma fusca TaxID=39272 RepID=A0A8J2KZ58_9HEXA|nr:unnamed protein product [Allacma fusca]